MLIFRSGILGFNKARGMDNFLQSEQKSSAFALIEKYIMWLFWGALALFLFLYATRPLLDPDLWWHLKNGQVMVETGGLLQSDPFTFTDDGVVSPREALILKGYWLWEITAYGLYSLLGFNGIFLLNLLSVGAIAAVLIWQLQRQKAGNPPRALLLTASFFLLISTYPLERPQSFTLLFIVLLMVLLTRVREGGRLGWTLLLLMLIWPQLHGGYVVGDLILICFAAGAVIEYRCDLPRLRHILFWIGMSIAATLLNPNGGLAFVELISFYNSGLMQGIREYKSTWEQFQEGYRWVAILWGLIAIYGISLWRCRRFYWPELFVALFLAYFSVKHTRNIGFFPLAMLPLIGCHFKESGSHRARQLSLFLSPLLVALCAAFLIWYSSGLWSGRKGSWPLESIYPEAAIEFLHESGLQGRMFNDYTYGGYLLWRLSPRIKVFIDGRGMDAEVFAAWQKLSMASTTWVLGRREYEVLLERYDIDYVIQPIYDGYGNIQPLMKGILDKPEWVPIYLDATVYILARVNAGNAGVINTYRMNKDEFKTQLLLIVNYLCQASPQVVGYQVARAGMLIYMGMYDEAKAQVAAIAALSPKERALPALQRNLAALQEQRSR